MTRILFLCVENRARSQMAEGLARHLLGHKCEVFSAGNQPASRVHPMATAVMAEIGIDISQQKPKSLDGADLTKMHYVVLLCDENICPTLPSSVKRLAWPTTDPAQADENLPAEMRIKKFRKVRDDLRNRIQSLSESLFFNG